MSCFVEMLFSWCIGLAECYPSLHNQANISLNNVTNFISAQVRIYKCDRIWVLYTLYMCTYVYVITGNTVCMPYKHVVYRLPHDFIMSHVLKYSLMK